MQEKNDVIDLRGMSQDEVFEAYAEIADEMTILEKVFEMSGCDLERALQIMDAAGSDARLALQMLQGEETDN